MDRRCIDIATHPKWLVETSSVWEMDKWQWYWAVGKQAVPIPSAFPGRQTPHHSDLPHRQTTDIIMPNVWWDIFVHATVCGFQFPLPLLAGFFYLPLLVLNVCVGVAYVHYGGG